MHTCTIPTLPKVVLAAQLLRHGLADVRSAVVQPHDGVVQGAPRLPVPHNRRLACGGRVGGGWRDDGCNAERTILRPLQLSSISNSSGGRQEASKQRTLVCDANCDYRQGAALLQRRLHAFLHRLPYAVPNGQRVLLHPSVREKGVPGHEWVSAPGLAVWPGPRVISEQQRWQAGRRTRNSN